MTHNISTARLSVSSVEVLIGIDPGVKTGLAVWHRVDGQLSMVATMSIIEAMDKVRQWAQTYKTEVWFEDARLRTWFGTKGREALQGAGSVKRDCSVWEEYCCLRGIKYRAIKPQAGATKWDAETFKRLTGWAGRTSEHSRDAALLVFQR